MANVIKHKRGSGSDPAANNLVIGELAIRTDTGKLFTKMDSGAIAEIAGGGSDIAINTLSSSSGTGGGSATFNGSAYRFTLSAPPSVSAAQLLVSINGVIQKPVTGTGQPSEGFAVDGTDIILGDAPETGADFFILTFKSLGVSEPADNSVTSAKIVDGAIVNADINASAAIDVSKLSGVLPSAGGTLTGNTTISSSGNPTFSIISTTQGGVPKIQLKDGYNRDNFISIDDNGDNLIIAVDEGSNGHASTIRHRIDGVEVGRITRTQNTSTIVHSLVGNVDISSGLDVTGAITGTGDLTIDTNTLHVDSSNNRVGIGTTSPTGQLHISSGTSGDCRVYIEADTDNNNEGDNPFIIFRNDGGFENAAVWAGNADGANDNSLNLSAGTDSGGGIRFFTSGINNGWETAPERMRIDSAGRVLIGTTTEGEDTGNDLTIANSGDCGITIRSGTSSKAKLLFSDGTSGDAEFRGNIQYDHNGDYMKFSTAASEHMRIDSSGNIGIGTTSPNVSGFNTDAQVLTLSGPKRGFIELRGDIQAADSIGGIRFFSANNLEAEIFSVTDGSYNGDLRFTTNGSERMRIDSSGNIMFGTTSNSVFDDTSGSGVVIRGATGALDIMRNNDHPLLLNRTGGDGQMIMFHRDGVNKSAIAIRSNSFCFDMPSGTEKMRIDSSGQVGIGTTSPAVPFHVDSGSLTVAGIFDNSDNTAYSSAAEGHFNNVLQLMSTTTTGQNDQSVGISFNLTLSGQSGSIQEIGAVRTGNGEGALVFRTRNSSEGRREKMRINSDGNMLVGTTTNTVNSANFGVLLGADGTFRNFRNTDGNNLVFRSGGNQGLLQINGDGDAFNTNNSYGQLSDQTLKQDIVDAASQWNDIKNLRVRKFRFKDNPTGVLQIGVVAQEIEKVSAGLVQEDEEGIKSVKYSVLYMKAVKCLQEAMAKIEVLETKVAALEAS